jgi:hypothetical protein
MSQAGTGASKITIEEEDPKLIQIQGVPTAVPGFLGVSEKGPVGVATLLTAHEDYVKIFGDDVANGKLSHLVRGFFGEGGQQCWVARTVHYSNIDDASSKTSAAATVNVNTGATSATSGTNLGANIGPFNLEPGDTIVASIDGGGNATATFTATAASRKGNAEPFALSNGQNLTISVDGGSVQTIAFLTGEFVSIGAATAEEVAAVINAKIVGAHATVTDAGTTVTITSDRRGTSSGINVTGGTANGAFGYSVGNLAGTGNVANIDAVTVAEVKTIVEAAIAGCTVTNAGGAVRITTNATGPSSSVQVIASSTADDELGLDNAVHSGTTGAALATLRVDAKYDGEYGNVVSVKIAAASNGEAESFDLQVLDDGRVEKSFPNLTMDSTAQRYAPTVVNARDTGSTLVILTDLALAGTTLSRRPANATVGPMTGGNDGLSGIVDLDYVGSSVENTGMYAFDKVDTQSLLSCDRATPAVHNAMTAYCEIWRDGAVFPVMDPPEGLSAIEMVTYVQTTAALLESSEFGEIFWPRVTVINPNRALYGNVDNIVVPPSGIICGVKARNDALEGGIYESSAGIEFGAMRTVTGFETDECLDEKRRDIVYPKRINPLTSGTGKPRFIDGAVTLKSTGNFPFTSQRRAAIFIEQSTKNGLEFVRHRNNTDALRAACDRTVRSFLRGEMRKGAFASMDPATAFFVDFGKGLNTDAVIFAAQLIGRIGLALNTPAEWVILKFSKDTRALETELAA